MLYRFDNLELDLDTFELRRDGRPIPIRKTTFDVLCYLIENRGRVVTKQELLDHLWAGTNVNESAIPWYISNLRKLFGQPRTQRTPLETVHGRGYQFKTEVQVIEKTPSTPEARFPMPTGETHDLFVGRREVMGRLNSALDSAIAGKGSIQILSGEAGIGKTRCAAEFFGDVIGRGHSVWMARCPELASQPPFWPWIQLLRNAAFEHPADSPIHLESSSLLSILVPNRNNQSTAQPPDSLSKTTDKFWLYDRLMRFLASSCTTAPRTLVVDDIQWADEASLEFLSFIAPDLASLPLLLVITLRDYEEMGNRAAHLHRLLRYTQAIPLTGLSEDDVDQYVSQSGLFERNEELSRAFHQKTGGNPLFLYETVRWLERTYSDTKKELTAADIRRLDVPDSIQKLLRCRLDTLDDETRSVIDVASVVGRTFDLALLSHALQGQTRTLVAALDRAIDAGLVTKESATRFRFTHDLTSKVAYDSLSSTTRADYHNRIADLLLTRLDVDADIGEVAFHLHEALPLSDMRATIESSEKAAALSARVYAHGDAALYYRWALEALSLNATIDPRVHTDLVVALGQQERLSGDLERSKQTISRALEMARAHRFFDTVSDIATIGRATFLSAHFPRPPVLEALKEALEHVPDEEKALRIRLLGQLALTPPFSTDMQLCKETSLQAVQLARELGDTPSMRIALNARLCAFTGPDDIDSLLETADHILRIQKEGEWTQAGIEAVLARVLAFIHRGDMSEAKKAIEVYGQLMTQLHRVEGEWFYQRLLAQHMLDEGRFDDAVQRFDELTRHAKHAGIYYFDIFRRIQRAYIMRARGTTIEQARDLCTNTIHRFRSVFSHAEFVGAIVEMGFPELVKDAYYGVVAHGLHAVPRNAMWLNTLSNLALAAVAFDDRPRMKELYDLLSPYAAFNTPNAIFLYDGPVAHYLGVLATKLDSDAKAIQHFEQAMEADQRMGFRSHLVRTQVVFTEWLAGRQEKKHKNRLKALVKEAFNSAREMNMGPLLKRAEALRIH